MVKSRLWSTTKISRAPHWHVATLALQWTPSMLLARIWQYKNLLQRPSRGGAATQQCTGFETFNYSQITLTQWGMQTPSWEQRISLHHHLQWSPKETCSFPAVAVSMAQRILAADTTKCQAKKLPGRELLDWVFDPLSSSWVSRDSENICWVHTTRQTDFKWLGPRLETGKYLT